MKKIQETQPHSFHIPVMGLGYTIDTPVKVGRFGISSVVSIIEDQLVEQMRKLYCEKENITYLSIDEDDVDHRAKRITAYLNLLHKILTRQVAQIKSGSFDPGSELTRYFELLPESSPLRKKYNEMLSAASPEKEYLRDELRVQIKAGSIDVNVMTKLDKANYSDNGEQLPVEYCDAMSALRGYALSDLESSIVFSAGLNPRLYSYCETFADFFQDENGKLKKKIILKVSDYRSALIQGKFFAKKGLWISEFRIESGLNCGGHAFATEGLLMGPILQEFKEMRSALTDELFSLCNTALKEKSLLPFLEKPETRITFQGGIGTAEENNFLMSFYSLDGTGWGSPFLLVPEATNVDDDTLRRLAEAKKEDYFLSYASPLGIPFNNFRHSSSEVQRKMRIEKGRPGSPCYKKFLAFDTEFTETPICTASRQYQNLKIKQMRENDEDKQPVTDVMDKLLEKDCLCEGLGASALLKNNLKPSHKMEAVTICPGPNLAYFTGTFSLEQMCAHIYGKSSILNSLKRPHIFINELYLYVDYLKKEIQSKQEVFTTRQQKSIDSFKANLLKGIAYYRDLIPTMKQVAQQKLDVLEYQLSEIRTAIEDMSLPVPALAH